MSSSDTRTDDVPFVSEQIARQAPATSTDHAQQRRRDRERTMRPIMWRLHYLGGLLAGPIVIWLALSGILYAWNPQLDQLRFGSIVSPTGQVQVALYDQVEAARQAYPEWTVMSVEPGTDRLNTSILMDPPGGAAGRFGPLDGVNVYVDQSTGEVTGALIDNHDGAQSESIRDLSLGETSDTYFRNLHSSWGLGGNIEILTELAGAWFIASLLIGLYLWWPGLRKRGSTAFALRRGLTGRRRSKEWHNFIGVALFVPMFFLAVTGLTWTEFSGDRVDLFKERVLGVRPSGSADGSLPGTVPGNTDLANIDHAYAAALSAGLVKPLSISVPADDRTGWKVSSQDAKFPVERDQIVVNGVTGEVVSSFDYSTEHWYNKLRTAGILFHQAQLFGMPLQIFMTTLALGIITMVFFGYRMWWQRRPSGGMGAPPPIRAWLANAPFSLLASVIFLAWLMPTLGLSLIVWLVLERGWHWMRLARGRSSVPATNSWLGKYDTTSPRVEALKALTIGGVGAAMLAAPNLGEGNAELTTIPRLAAVAWSPALGAVFLAIGLVGLIALIRSRRAVPVEDAQATAS